MGLVFQEFGKGIDQVFEKARIGFVPKPLRYLICLALLLSPVIAIIVMICMDDESPPVETKKTS